MAKENYIADSNLTLAWGKAISLILDQKGYEIQPLFVSVTMNHEGCINQEADLLIEIDNFLDSHEKYSCHTVANTIFPRSLWNPIKDRKLLYDRFEKIYPTIKKVDSGNIKGRYFERLINYQDKKHKGKPINQLEYIISTRMDKGNPRRSAYQASILNPYIDHTHQRQSGFPCLQQVSFIPNSKKNTLSIMGYYPFQYLVDRAYGNYMGLCWLGQFMAHEMDLKFTEMTCVAGIAHLGKDINKTDKDLNSLIDRISERYKPHGDQ